MKDFLESAPGLVGDVARHVYACLEYDEPGIALAAALAFVGALKSQRICNEFKIPPCIYSAIIADSGIGKSQAQSAIKEIIKEAGLSTLLMGRPASDVGLISALESESRRLLIWDEFGIALGSLSKSKASHEALILSTIMDLFSSAGKQFVGKEYSKNSNRQRIDIKEPYLSIFAASTPNRFFDSLSKDFVFDGFLPRWLLFFSTNNKEKFLHIRDYVLEYEVPSIPQSIIKQVRAIDKGKPKTSGGDVEKILFPEKIKVSFDSSSLKALKLLKKSCKMNYLDNTGTIKGIFYSRIFEYVVRISTLLEEEGFVSNASVLWAEELVTKLALEAIVKCDISLFDNSVQKQGDSIREKILLEIPARGMISKSELTRKTFRCAPAFQRNSVLQDLIESEIISTQVLEDPKTLRQITFYKRGV